MRVLCSEDPKLQAFYDDLFDEEWWRSFDEAYVKLLYHLAIYGELPADIMSDEHRSSSQYP